MYVKGKQKQNKLKVMHLLLIFIFYDNREYFAFSIKETKVAVLSDFPKPKGQMAAYLISKDAMSLAYNAKPSQCQFTEMRNPRWSDGTALCQH